MINSYESAKEYLFSRIQFGMKAGLDNITRLCNALGNPEKRLKSIHIAGTNGKGSTSYYLSKMLTAHGYKTGLYTSPHLVSVRERIRIDDQPISEEDLAHYVAKVAACSQGIDHTFFETITAVAFAYFADAGVDFVVLETGLGGRLDSTNVCSSICTVITGIALDHTAILGNTKSEILSEKLGIVKTGVPLFINLKESALVQQAEDRCTELHAPMSLLSKDAITRSGAHFSFLSQNHLFADIVLANPGNHYHENASLALSALEFCIPSIDVPLVKNTLANAGWPARMQILKKDVATPFILDGGHNPDGIRAMLDSLIGMYPGQKHPFLIAVLADKDLRTMARLIEPYASEIIITKSTHPKSLSPELGAKEFLVPVTVFQDLHDALNYCRTIPAPTVCTGSLYFMGDVIESLKWEFEELAWFRPLTPDSNEVR